MHLFKLIEAAAVVCLAFAAYGCQQHSKQSLAMTKAAVEIDDTKVEGPVKSKEAEVNAVDERLDAYVGDKFSDAEKALASKPPDPDVPTF